MMKATIYYNVILHPQKSKFSNLMWHKINHEDDLITLKRGQFARFWRKLPMELNLPSEVPVRSHLENIFMKFNDYDLNPLSEANGGQHIIKERGIRHTSMSVGDVIKIDKKYYMVAGVGFRELKLK